MARVNSFFSIDIEKDHFNTETLSNCVCPLVAIYGFCRHFEASVILIHESLAFRRIFGNSSNRPNEIDNSFHSAGAKEQKKRLKMRLMSSFQLPHT